eukprot:11240611-Ditylum_brightwellii.AAC.1
MAVFSLLEVLQVQKEYDWKDKHKEEIECEKPNGSTANSSADGEEENIAKDSPKEEDGMDITKQECSYLKDLKTKKKKKQKYHRHYHYKDIIMDYKKVYAFLLVLFPTSSRSLAYIMGAALVELHEMKEESAALYGEIK